MPFSPELARSLARSLLPAEEWERLQHLDFRDAGHGYDPFGLHPDFVALGAALVAPLYDRYFRVRTYDAHHLPAEGPAILAANHSGTLPLDAVMLWLDVLRHTEPPRVARPVADYFVPRMPFVGTLFARAGMVGGSRGNARRLLEAGELLMIFPEGVPGIGKPFRERYRLQEWRVGHAELAIRHRAPVVPVGIVGAEEQMPQLGRIEGIQPFGAPYLPIALTPVPLPVRYHLLYGEPLPLHRDYHPREADDPEVVREAAGRVERAVKALLRRGLAAREGVFR